MATSVNLGYMLWSDGQEWTSLLSRQFAGGAATWDTNASATAVNPLGGVFNGAGSPLEVTQQASPDMSVLVNAGYVAVPHPTAQYGAYLFGLQAQSTLTIGSNSTEAARYDLIVARVYDTDDDSSYCDIEVVQGTAGDGQPATPSAAWLLAVVEVPSDATSITSSDITDERTFTVAPGGVLPASSAGAPALAPGQILFNTTLGSLERAAIPEDFTASWTEAGTYTWTSPITGTVRAQLWAAGGGGSQDTSGASDTPGGGGEYAEEPAYVVEANTDYTIVVGAGGTGGNDSTAPGDGGNTTLNSTAIVANGGQGGVSGAGGGNGKGGTGSTNTIHWDGGDAGLAPVDPPVLGGSGGGSSAGPLAAGADGFQATTRREGAAGGAAPPGGGTGGAGGDEGFAGEDGGSPGGGGGQAGDGEGTDINGGDGADGQVVLSWSVLESPLTAVFATDSAVDDLAVVNTSQGETGLDTGGTSGYGWGIGGGTNNGSFDADSYVVWEIEVGFDADGATDFQFDAKWGLAVPEAAVDSPSPSISHGQCRMILQLDGYTLDQVYLRCAASGGVTSPGDGGAWTYYTSSQRGDTPSSGAHTLALAIQTEYTQSGYLSGVHIGDLASVGTSPHPFGGALPSWFTSALTAENCSLRVAGIQAASI